MSYIGKEPADSFISFAKQDFSTSATTSYTLDNAVTNENELALFINFVRQEPTTAYTASGTSLTLTSATASGDDMYCIYLGMAKQTVNAPDGSVGSSQVASTIITGQTAETSIATDDTVLIHDTSAGALRKMTRANFTSGVGGLTLISTHTETSGSAGTIDMNGVFTSSYDRYRINIDQFNMASPSTLLMQLGSGGTVATGIYQFVGLGFRSDNTEIRGNTNSATAINLQAGTGSDYQSNSPAGTPTAFLEIFI